MKYLILLLNVLGFWLMADVAHADPISAAIAAIGNFIGSISIGKLVLTVAINIGLSLVEKALAKKDQPQPAGTKLEINMGDDHAMSFIIGSYATAGKRKYAGTWGDDGKTPNAYFTDVIEVGSLPNRAGERGLTSVWIDDQKVGVLWDQPHPDGRGFPVLQYRVKNKDYLWIKFLDGTQTSPDPFLMAKFGTHAERPWKPTMIGRGCQVVILTSRYNTDLFKGVPAGLFEPHPLPLYDVRKDSSVGGNGGHRWSDPSTWQPSTNPAVMIYNLARGVYYGPEWVYGGQNIGAFCLPAANWMAAANACDASVPLDGGGSEPAYRAGYDVQCDQEPLDAVSELLKGCNGRMAEVGGIFKMLVGSPGGAVYSFTDDDVVVTEEQDFQPFLSLSATYNSIEATYPEPAEKWATKDAPGRYNADLEVQDGNRRLPAEIQLLAVPFANQVQRVGLAMIQDYRRFRVHQISLPPDAYPLEPNDVVSWSSVRNGYDEKKFLVVKVEPQPNFLIVVTLKEVDPADYDWHPGLQLPTAIGWLGPITPPSQPMIGWTVEPSTIKDAGGIDRRPAIKISCAPDLDDVRGVWVQVRVKASGDVVFDSDSNPYALPFSWIISGQWTLPNTEYEVRGRYLPQSNRATDWSAWLTVKTPNVLIQASDVLDGAIVQSKIADAAVSAAKIMDEAVSNVKLANQAVSTAKLQVAAVTADVLASGAVISAKLADGAVTAAKLAQGAVDATSLASSIKAVEVVAALPTTSNIEGRQVFLTTDGKLYRYHNGAWTAATPAADITGQISDAQVAAVAAAKVMGTLVSSQIADTAITNAKLAVAAIDATKFASGIRPVEIVSSLPTIGNAAGRTVYLSTDGKLYRYTGSAWTAGMAAGDVTGQLTASQIADAAVTGSKLAAQAITNDKIATNSIYGAVVAAGSITARELLLTDFTNLVANGDWASPDIASTWDFTGNGNIGIANGFGKQGGRVLVLQRLVLTPYNDLICATKQNPSYLIPVTEGATYAYDTSIMSNVGIAPAGFYYRLNLYDYTRKYVTYYDLVGNAPLTGSWVDYAGQYVIPAGIRYVGIALYNSGSNSTTQNVLVNHVGFRKANAAQLTVDGGITASKLAVGAVTADKIAANAITAAAISAGAVGAAQIAASAITADKVAAGAISANLLATGNGANQLSNSDSIAGTTGWSIVPWYGGGDINRWSLSHRTDGYGAAGSGSFELSGAVIGGVQSYSDFGPMQVDNPAAMQRFPVTADGWYEFSGRYYAQGTKALTFFIDWYDGNGKHIDYSAVGYNTATMGGNPLNNLAAYGTAFVKARAPAKAVYCLLFIRNEGTTATSGTANSYAWFTQLYFGVSNVNQTVPSVWSPGGVTLVSGGNIVTGAIAADKIAANAVTAGKVAANAVTAGTIAANAVTAGTIAAGAVSAAQIAAGAITADKLAAGSVSTQALAVGTGGNYLSNSDLSAGLTGWALEFSNDAASFSLGLQNGTYAPSPGAIEIRQANSKPGIEYGVGPVDAYGSLRTFAVRSNGWYELSVYYLGHRCNGIQPYIGVFDASDKLLDWMNWGVSPASQNIDPQRNLANYQRFWNKLQMPANAARARVFFRMKGTIAGQNDSYLWLTRMYFGEANPNQTEPTPWSDGSVTLIAGGNIATGAISADKIAAKAITADKIAAGAVTAASLGAGSVTAVSIAGGTITGDKLAANTIGADQIAAQAITAKQLLLTDFSNMADNGWQKGTLDGWAIQNRQNFYIDNSSGDWAGYVLQSLGRDCAVSNLIAVTPGEVFAFDAWVYNTDAGSANIFAGLQTPSGVWAPNLVPGAMTGAKYAWVRLQGRFAIPSGYTKLAMLLQVDKTAGTGNSCYWSKPVMRRAASAELIVDGAITANKIAANSITADKLNINSLDAITANIGNLQVGTSNIVGGAITRVDTGLPEGAAGINANSGPIPVTGITCVHGAGSPSILVLSSFSLSNNGSNPNNYFTQVEVHIWDNANNRYTAVLPFSFYSATSFTHSFSFRPPADRTETQFRFDVKPINLPSLGSPPLLINNRIINALTLKR